MIKQHLKYKGLDVNLSITYDQQIYLCSEYF